MGRTKGLHHKESSGLLYGLREALDTLRTAPAGRHHRRLALSLARDVRKAIALAILPVLYSRAIF